MDDDLWPGLAGLIVLGVVIAVFALGYFVWVFLSARGTRSDIARQEGSCRGHQAPHRAWDHRRSHDHRLLHAGKLRSLVGLARQEGRARDLGEGPGLFACHGSAEDACTRSGSRLDVFLKFAVRFDGTPPAGATATRETVIVE